MRYFLFAILFFALPHAQWIPKKLGVPPESIPLGVVNLILCVALLLWAAGKGSGGGEPNTLRQYTWFIAVVSVSVVTAVFTGYEADAALPLTLAKREISLLLLYFVPLAVIRDDRDFTVIFLICLAVHLVIALEVLDSGVLSGSNFNDGKRGSGPFSTGFAGSDVAGGYVAQVLGFFLAFVLVEGERVSVRLLAAGASVVIVFALFATFARGALIAAGAGLLAMVLVKGMKPRYLLPAFMFLSLILAVAPESIVTRFASTKNESGELDKSSQGRVFYYETALAIVRDHPLGVGTGQMRAAMSRYIADTSDRELYVDPHNGFLFTACEYGVIGLFIFVAMLWNAASGAAVRYRSSGCPRIYRAYFCGTVGMIATLAVCNLFYANFYKDLVMGTIAIHLGIFSFAAARVPEETAATLPATTPDGE